MHYDVEILKVTPFRSPEGHGRASVVFRCGPVVVRAKIFEKEGRLWLGMPGRKETNGEKWFDSAFIPDRLLHKSVEVEALRCYERACRLPDEMVQQDEPLAAALAG